MPASIAIERNNVKVIGKGRQTLVLVHGFGCDQNMWRFLTPYLDQHHRIVLFDYTGSGKSDASEFSVERYGTLDGYAQDLIEVCQGLDLQDVVLIGHSVSAMIGLIVSIQVPTLFSKQIMICPSPCFLNDPPGYLGGFDRADIERPFAVLMIDIDHFKSINDTFGHTAGDEVLRAFGLALKSVARDNEIIARYGGEEFICALQNADAEGALSVASRVHAAARTLQAIGRPVNVSFGVVDRDPQGGRDLAALIHQADLALYQAKSLGRNRTQAYGAPQG
jgi:diguanylate cyclase (GGDEF)-like protein